MTDKKPIYDEYDPWTTYDPSPTVVRRTPNRVRNRKPTLASAIRQARKAGIEVTGATVTKDGVSLEFGNRAITGKASGVEDDFNEWDVVKQ
jgi:hypothetical protein